MIGGAGTLILLRPVYDWLLFLHLLGAVMAFAAVAVLGTSILGASRSSAPGAARAFLGLARPGGVLFDIGGVLLLVFGIWLAFEADYGITDEWILAAIVLWAIAAYAGQRGDVVYGEAQKLATRLAGEGRADEPNPELRALLNDRRAIWLNVASSIAALLILVDMIYKPGA